MAKFRKKPVVVDAIRVSDVLSAYAEGLPAWRGRLPMWFRAAYEDGIALMSSPGVAIKTLEGLMEAGPADWIIRGVKGELYPCKPDIFDATYEPADG